MLMERSRKICEKKLIFFLTYKRLFDRISIVLMNEAHMREWLSWWSTTLPRWGSRVRVPSRARLKRLTNVDFITFVSFLFCKNRGTIRVHSLFWAYSPYSFTHFCLPKHLIPTISVDITKA